MIRLDREKKSRWFYEKLPPAAQKGEMESLVYLFNFIFFHNNESYQNPLGVPKGIIRLLDCGKLSASSLVRCLSYSHYANKLVRNGLFCRKRKDPRSANKCHAVITEVYHLWLQALISQSQGGPHNQPVCVIQSLTTTHLRRLTEVIWSEPH